MRKLLKGNEVADYLNVSRSQAYTLMQKGIIPTIRLGKNIRVNMEDLENFIDQNRYFNNRCIGNDKLAAGTASDRKPQTNEVFHDR
jgi:excisionase family DNA binding protein